MIDIERLGGFAGFGGGRLRSRGRMALADLSAAHRAAVDGFFAAGSEALATRAPPGAADMFRYRLTRTRDGKVETVEVPETLMPPPLVASVKDTLE